MEEQKKVMPEEYAKEGFIPLVHEKGGKKIILYVENGMTTFVAYDGAMDIAMHLRALYHQQIQEAVDKETKEDN